MSSTPLASPTRRMLVRNVAWSVPVVSMAAAAPAFAASPCDRRTYTMAWSGSSLNRTSARLATGTATATGGSSLAITLTSNSFSGGVANNTATSNNRPDTTRNLSVPPLIDGQDGNLDPGVTSLGGRANERGVRLQHSYSLAGRDNRQEVTISFSRPVRGLDFFITDIDMITSSPFSDRVELSSVPSVARVQTLDGITGSGTAPNPTSNPWQRAADLNVDENSAGAQVRVQYPTTTDITSLTLTYWNNSGGSQYHRIYIGNMTFSAAGCA